MKGLLVVQGNQLSSDFKFDLGQFGQELWLGVSSSVTIATGNYCRRSRIFLELVRSKSGRPIRGPACLQRGMLRSFGGRLRGMMTFDARDLGALDAAILRCMIEVTELYRPQLCLRTENDHVLWLASILGRSLRTQCAGNEQDGYDEERK